MDRRQRLPTLQECLQGTRADDARWPLVVALAAELGAVGLTLLHWLA